MRLADEVDLHPGTGTGSWGESEKWLLLAIFFAAPLATLRVGGGITFADAFLLLAGLLAVCRLIARRRFPVSAPWIWWGAAILVFSMVLGQLIPPATVEPLEMAFSRTVDAPSVLTSAQLLLALVALPIIVCIVVDCWSTIPALATAFIAGVSASCSVALLDAYLGTSLQISLATDEALATSFLDSAPTRYLGLTVHPNHLAFTVVLALPLVLAKMTSVRRLLLGLPVCVLFMVAVLLSGSRMGLIGVAFVVFASLALNPRIRSVALTLRPGVLTGYLAALVVTVLLAFFVPIQGPPLGQVPAGVDSPAGVNSPAEADSPAGLSRLGPGDSSAEESDAIRRQYLEDSVSFIADRPLVGYGYQWVEASHNVYLQFLVAGGVIALAGFLIVMAGYFRQILELRGRISGSMLDLLVGSGISLAALLLMGMTSNLVVERFIYLPVLLVMAMAALVASHRSAPSDQ